MKKKSPALSRDELYFLFVQFPIEDIRNAIPKLNKITLINTESNKKITIDTAMKLLGRRKFLYHAVKCIKIGTTTAHNLQNNTEIYFEYHEEGKNETKKSVKEN